VPVANALLSIALPAAFFIVTVIVVFLSRPRTVMVAVPLNAVFRLSVKLVPAFPL